MIQYELRLITLLLSFLLVILPLQALADFTGQVVGVIDGDTIDVLHNGQSERVRLKGIDCPEKGQAYGTKAKQATSVLVFRKEVTLQTHGKDKYGRIMCIKSSPLSHSRSKAKYLANSRCFSKSANIVRPR